MNKHVKKPHPSWTIIFLAFGRHPLAGLAAAFAGVSGGYSANLAAKNLEHLSFIYRKEGIMVDTRTQLYIVWSRLFLLAAASVLAGICFDAQLSAQTQVTIGALKDNTLYESSTGALSNGAGEHFFAGRVGLTGQGLIRRGLISFNIAGSSIPSGSVIQSVTLRLNMSQTVSGAQTLELRRVLANWGEGTSNAVVSGGGGGAPSTTEDATWIHTFYNTSLWSNAGGDFSGAASANQSVGSTFGFYTWGSTPEMVADVQAWLNNPSTNFGWLLRGNEATIQTTKRFDARENLTPTLRPVLTVTYTPLMGVTEGLQLPTEFFLHQNHPNPFNPATAIRYDLPSESHVVLKIYNLLGNEVTTLVDAHQTPGLKSVTWDGKDEFGNPAPSGIYIYRIKAGNTAQSRKMILMK